jgi:hypothetical protein
MVAMITAAAGFHITLYSVPRMRGYSAARPPLRYPWRPAGPFTRRVHHRAVASAPRAAAGGSELPGGPGEDQQRQDNRHAPLPQGSGPRGPRPPLRPLRPPRLRSHDTLPRRVHLGRGAGRRARGCAAASATARSRSEGCGRSSKNSGPLPPFASAPDDPELEALIGAGWSVAQVRGRGPPPAGRVRDPAYLRRR